MPGEEDKKMDAAYARLSLLIAILGSRLDHAICFPYFEIMVRRHGVWNLTWEFLEEIKTEAGRMGFPAAMLEFSPEELELAREDGPKIAELMEAQRVVDSGGSFEIRDTAGNVVHVVKNRTAAP